MVVLPAGSVHVAAEVARIAAAAGGIDERAAALLEPLHGVIPFDGAWIGLLDPERRGHLLVVDRGYDDRVRAHLDGPQVLGEIERMGLRRWRQAPVRLRDVLEAIGEPPGWVEYMRPAGFRDGVGVGLFTPDGRYLGVLSLHLESESGLTDAACGLLGVLASTIAAAVDPIRPLSVLAGMVEDATAGIVLTRAGDPLPLPGLASHPLLAAGSALLPVAAPQLEGLALTSFLSPYPDHKSGGRHVRVTVLACPPDLPDYLTAIVLLSPALDLHGLTPRELEIMGLLVEGWPNARIAAALFVTESTIATHVEHILAKLAVPARSSAAVLALRIGLYVPRRLTAIGPP
jgi:DNA-binding CsgD family transcriptional regulator